MANVTLKRYNGTSWDVLDVATTVDQVSGLSTALNGKVASSEVGQPGGVAALDGNGKIPLSQIPDAVVSGGIELVTGLNAGSADLDDAAGQLDGAPTDVGLFFVVTSPGTINDSLTTAKWEVGTYDDGDDIPPAILVEVGDWIMCTSYSTFHSFSIINNANGLASATTSGLVQLSNASVYSTLAGNHVITEGILKTVIDEADFAASGHNHASTYLGINATADAALKLATARSITLNGDVSGTVNFDGSANVTITTTVANDSHDHTADQVDWTGGAFTNLSGTHVEGILTSADVLFTSNLGRLDTLEAKSTVHYEDAEGAVVAPVIDDLLIEF